MARHHGKVWVEMVKWLDEDDPLWHGRPGEGLTRRELEIGTLG